MSRKMTQICGFNTHLTDSGTNPTIFVHEKKHILYAHMARFEIQRPKNKRRSKTWFVCSLIYCNEFMSWITFCWIIVMLVEKSMGNSLESLQQKFSVMSIFQNVGSLVKKSHHESSPPGSSSGICPWQVAQANGDGCFLGACSLLFMDYRVLNLDVVHLTVFSWLFASAKWLWKSLKKKKTSEDINERWLSQECRWHNQLVPRSLQAVLCVTLAPEPCPSCGVVMCQGKVTLWAQTVSWWH